MEYFILKFRYFVLILLLSFCSAPFKNGESEQNKEFYLIVTKVDSSRLVMNLYTPRSFTNLRYINISMHECSENILPIKSYPTKEDKNKVIMLMFIEEKNKLNLLFYKESVSQSEKGVEIRYNPFNKENPVMSIFNKPIGVKIGGFSRFVASGSGDGILKSVIGDPIIYDSVKGYEIILNMNDQQSGNWKFLAGIVRISMFNPGLETQSIFNLCSK